MPDASTPVKLSLPLPYQQEIFNELRAQDELVVLAPGLGLLHIVGSLLHTYDASGDNLVVVIGADDREIKWLAEALLELTWMNGSVKAGGLNNVNTDVTNVGTRIDLYEKGGIFSVTSQILVVDLLSGVLDPARVSGIIVLHAEKVTATSIEAFILRLYREKNKDGFLKAFSDTPEYFTMGFAPLSRMMRNLFLSKTSFWPRFQLSVAKSLEGRKRVEVIELAVPMSDSMIEIQQAIWECVEISVRELRTANKELDLAEWNVETALHRDFDRTIRRQLDPNWHRVSWRTKQISNDLTTLRQLLFYLLTMDCVAFNEQLEMILASHQPPPGSTRMNQSPWLFLDEAHTLFETGRRRVYSGSIAAALAHPEQDLPTSLRLVLEEQPKWLKLAEILQEIEQDKHFEPAPRGLPDSVLIMCGSQYECRQIREYLSSMRETKSEEPSASAMLRRKMKRYLAKKPQFARVTAMFTGAVRTETGHTSIDQYKGQGPPNKRRRLRGGATAVLPKNVNGSVPLPEFGDAEQAVLIEAEESSDDEDLDAAVDSFGLLAVNDVVAVHVYDGDMDDHILEELQPRYIVMYTPDTAFIRRVEVYRSSHTDRTVRVYFMYYDQSVEEKRYLGAVRGEKDAFTKLIGERSKMALTIAGDSIEDPADHFLRINTRIAGGGRLAPVATAQQPTVVVDIREFRSTLPSLLHGSHMLIVPCTLTVGDYVLSPDIVVERKSLRDLVQSFRSGRLYSQTESMSRHYRHPMLLIEFDQNRSFTLELFRDRAIDRSGTVTGADGDLQARLVLLAVHFPKLRIVWSSTPYQTAEIFAELKRSNPEPDPAEAVKIGLGIASANQPFNETPQDMLRCVPGVNSSNIGPLMFKFKNLVELANAGEREITDLIGRESGAQIYRFFNQNNFE